MKTGINPCVDYVFKRVFGGEDTKPILLNLLHAVRPREPFLVKLLLLNPFNEQNGPDDKLSILDIKAKDDHGQHYNVEMQLFGSHVHLQRVLYYWANLHGAQLHKGDKYPSLRPTISIAIVNTVLFPEVPLYHLEFHLRNDIHPHMIFSKQLAIHLIELPKFHKNVDELTDALDVWCYFLKHGAELDPDDLPVPLRTPPVEHAMEVLNMLSQDEVERERYRARLKWQRDEEAFINEAREFGWEEGHQKGKAEGIAEGIEKGKLVASVQFCQRFLKQPLTSEEELRALAIDDLRLRATSLEKQLGLPEA